MRISDWSSDVCSSDLLHMFAGSVTAGLDAVLLGDQQSPLPARNTRHVDDALFAYADALRNDPPLNLLQGEYAPRRRVGPSPRAWRLVAGLAPARGGLRFVSAYVDRAQFASLGG